MNGLAEKIGCKPSMWTVWRSRRLAARYYFGSLVSYQFRLSGHGKDTAMAREVMLRLPIGWSRRDIARYSVQSVLSTVEGWLGRLRGPLRAGGG